jgi:hypothetical protein
MDYTIYPSTIPQHQLLRIDEAQEVYESAFDDQVFYGVRNPNSPSRNGYTLLFQRCF